MRLVLDAFVLAVALSMDVTAVSMACGAAGAKRATIFRMAWLFAIFHIAMSSGGWLLGEVAAQWIESWDHWLAFGLLAFIGGKAAWSAMQPEPVAIPTSWSVLLGLAVATSIDAVAAGVSLSVIDAPEIVTVSAIGVTVFVFVMIAGSLGARLGDRFGRAFQVLGGVALIAIGAKTLVEHLTA